MGHLGRRVTASAVAAVVCAVTWTVPAHAGTQTPTPSTTSSPEPSPTPEQSPSPPPDPLPDPPPPPDPAPSPPLQPEEPAAPPAAPTVSPKPLKPADPADPGQPVPPADASPFVRDPAVEIAVDPTAALLHERAHDVMSAHSMAVADAETALKDALFGLPAAEAALTKAEAEAEAARVALSKARVALAIATEQEKKIRQELADVLAGIADIRDDLGALAREEYRGRSFATLSVVLDADTPDDYADSYVGARTVLRAGDALLGQLAAQRADLVNTRERLTAIREEKEDLAAKAAEALKARETAVEAAATAQRELAEAAKNRATALAAAEQARERDYQRYREFLAESQALQPVIVEMSSLLVEAKTTRYGTGSFVRPGTGVVTSDFGIRRHPITGVVKLHTGIDIALGDGYVYAADAGTVVKAEWNRAYGNMTVIDHGHGVTTLYGHQASISVKVGDQVTKGARIGVVGSTGYSTGPHLHFEIRQDGEPIDPSSVISGAPLPYVAP
jgi:murein DD-endopeptidase MepM/ murein hydrolase activator NlpD